jgi:hypothetical protein
MRRCCCRATSACSSTAAGDVLDAVAGVPLSAADLHAVLTGCAPAMRRREGRALGDDWRLSTARRRRAVPAPLRRRATVAARLRRPARVARRLSRRAERAAAHDADHSVARDGGLVVRT